MRGVDHGEYFCEVLAAEAIINIQRYVNCSWEVSWLTKYAWQELVSRELPRTQEEMLFGLLDRHRYVNPRLFKGIVRIKSQQQLESQDVRFLWEVSRKAEERCSTPCETLPYYTSSFNSLFES
jgi:hypothetical protein